MAAPKSKTGVRVARDLVQAIYDNGLAPGDRYLSEPEALKEHGVSRATYREAARFLEFQGVLGTRAGPGGGTVVAQPDWRNLASTYALLMQFTGTSRAHVMAARRLLEPEMAAEAARNATGEHIADMRRLAAIAQDHVADVARFIPAYRGFWHCVADATGNPVIAELWKALRAVIDSGQFVPNERYRARLVTALSDILQAIEAHDEVSAARLVRELDGEFAERLSRDYPQQISRTVAWSDLDIDGGAQSF